MTEAINPKDSAARASNRTMLGLLAPVFKEAVTRVMMYGAFKSPRTDGTSGYGPYNWRDQPVKLSTYLDACERHIDAIRRGEWIDSDSGQPHAAHIGANANIILDARHCGTLVDDLLSKDPHRFIASWSKETDPPALWPEIQA